jgi:hypothetical protein
MPATRPGAGGAAGDFLNSHPNTGQRPGQPGTRPGDRPGQPGTRPGDRPGQRPGTNPVRRPGDGVGGNRPDRVENRGQRNENRHSRRDEVRNQFRDNHPRYDFWRGHPSAARWRWNRPYRRATWGLVTGFFPWGWNNAVQYNYGDNVYYEDNSVYYGDEIVATSEEYAAQAQTIAESAPEVNDEIEWMPLGVFAVTQDDEKSGPPPTLFLQLAVNKQGVIGGTFQNTSTEKSETIEGMIDQKSQRSAWTITGKKWPVMETGISNLTQDTAPALMHFESGETQQWLLVRLEEPKEEAATK